MSAWEVISVVIVLGRLSVYVRTLLVLISDIACYFNEYDVTVGVEQLTVICLARPNTTVHNVLSPNLYTQCRSVWQ